MKNEKVWNTGKREQRGRGATGVPTGRRAESWAQKVEVELKGHKSLLVAMTLKTKVAASRKP